MISTVFRGVRKNTFPLLQSNQRKLPTFSDGVRSLVLY